MNLKNNKLKIKNRNRLDYQIFNVILILLFLIGFIYIISFDNTPKCYFKENFDVFCRTCGLTRDFKSIIVKLNFSNLINPFSIYFFVSLTGFFISRFISLVLLSNNIKLTKIVIFDVIIGMIGVMTIAANTVYKT